MLGGPREIGLQILRIELIYIILIVAVNVIDRGLMTFKWSLLLRGRGIRLPFIRGMIIYCASALWGLFLPTTVGSDAIRAYSTSRAGLDSREVVASIIIERFLGFLSALLLAILSLVLLTHLGNLGDQVKFVWLLAGGMLLVAILLFVISVSKKAFNLFHDRILHRFRNNRIAQKLREFHETYRFFVIDRQNLAVFFGLTFGEQLLPIFDMWLIARGMGIEVGILYFAAVLPLALLISRIPISIDGIGVFEGVLIVLLSLAGLSAAQAVAIAIVGRILQTIALVPWWMAFVISHKNLRIPRPLSGKKLSSAH
jgi:uncharacterized protein (TIRG00374 family)